MNTDNTNDITNNDGGTNISPTDSMSDTEFTYNTALDVTENEDVKFATAEHIPPADDTSDRGTDNDADGENGILRAEVTENSELDTIASVVTENSDFDTIASAVTDSSETIFSPPEIPVIDDNGAADINETDNTNELFATDEPEADGSLIDGTNDQESEGSEAQTKNAINNDAADKETENEANGEKKSKKVGYDPEHPRGIDAVFDFVELFVFSLVAVLVVTTFFFRHSIVEGSSMEQTLFEGEHLIISNLFYTPERGDIIVCEDYSTTLRKPIVKRVIGIEGDRVQVLASGEVYVNGELLHEDYVYIDFYSPEHEVDVIVPEGEIFVMGDHRNMSTDSREIGTVDDDSVLGKVLLRFYPFDKFGKVD